MNSGKNKSNKIYWIVGNLDSTLDFAVVSHISFIMFINSLRFLLFGPIIFILFIPMLLFSVIFIRPDIVDEILSEIGFVLPIFSIIGIIAGYFFFLKEREFNIDIGKKIFFSSTFFRIPAFFFLLGIIMIPTIVFGDALYGHILYNLPIYERFIDNIKIGVFLFYMPFLLFILFLWGFHTFFINPNHYTNYAIRLLDSNISFKNKKSKLYHSIKLVYQTTKIKMRDLFGENSEDKLHIENILRLATFIETMDKKDEESYGTIRKILKDLYNTNWYDEPKKFQCIMNDIEKLTDNEATDFNKITKNIRLQRIKQYGFLVISALSITLNTVSYIFNRFLS